jgi:threonyl-tRNA synthetase
VITVRLPDGTSRDLEDGATGLTLAESIGRRLAKAAVAVSVDGATVDLDRPLPDGAEVAVITVDSDGGRAVLRHSTAHVLAQAVLQLWPGAHYAIGPSIADGFYYDFELPGGSTFSDDDLERIEEKMRAIMDEDQAFVREEHTVEQGLALFADQPFKREIIEGVARPSPDAELSAEASLDIAPDASAVSTYRNVSRRGAAGAGVDGSGAGRFVDLCRGPHVASTGRLGHFKLLRVAGAYWRGDEHRPQLQRIYGTAWESDKALAEHLHRVEEAERRDHRRIGAELDLFSFPTEIGSGLAVFHPKGATIRMLMEQYSRQRHLEGGYQFVNTPHISKSELFEVSGHLDWFAEGFFPAMELDDGQRYYLKPMNCPFHILVYRSHQRSYRELPMRLFEFGTVYRHEKSGVVHGLTRVRGLTMDDSHIFCTRQQIGEELGSLLTFVLDLLGDFGLEDFYLELSTRPPGKAVGTDEEWAEATEALRTVAEGRGLELVMDEGGGAFYGPKISVQARDAIGRHWQVSTIQLDFQLPQRFDLEYVGADNARHRPVMIHRALFGSVERFFAILLEHYAGALPTWLMPTQVVVLPVRDDHDDYAQRVATSLRGAQVRVEVDTADEPLNARIRRWKLEKVPYVLVVGDDDVTAATVGVNARSSPRPIRGVALDAFIAALRTEIDTKGSPEREGTVTAGLGE